MTDINILFEDEPCECGNVMIVRSTRIVTRPIPSILPKEQRFAEFAKMCMTCRATKKRYWKLDGGMNEKSKSKGVRRKQRRKR